MTISIVIPIYNSEGYLRQCIESALHQDVPDFEIVLVDDGSTDSSSAICDDYTNHYSFVHVIHQSNAGRSEARWSGVKASKGDWVMFVDSDDLLPENSCSHLLKKAAADVDIVLGGGNRLSVKHGDRINTEEFRHLAVRAEGYIGVPWGSLYRRSFLRYYFFNVARDICMGEDYIFWLRMAFTTDRPIAVAEAETYSKKEGHSYNSFTWTADYARRINDLRMSAIPAEDRDRYLLDSLADRIFNLILIADVQKRSHWDKHPFFLDIKRDVMRSGYHLPFKQRVYLSLPSLWLRHLYSAISKRRRYRHR